MILAPHPDDELIGCWSLLQAGLVKKVVFLNDLTWTRMAEANACAAAFGFEAVFAPAGQLDTLSGVLGPLDVLAMPSIMDSHPDHKETNRIFRGHTSNRRFYSVDLQNCPDKVLLSPKDRQAKFEALNCFYPSQRSLWDYDASYYLFEKMAYYDHSVNIEKTVYLSGEPAELTVPAHLRTVEPNTTDTALTYIDRLISGGATTFKLKICSTGIVYENRN